MSLWTPPPAFSVFSGNVVDEASLGATTVTAHATPHTKGSYSEVIASTPFDVYGMAVVMSNSVATGADSSMLVDLAVGAAASEVVIIPNLAAGFGNAGSGGHGQRYWFPLFIPAGSRIAARSQATITVDTVSLFVWLYGKPNQPVWAGRKVTAYGADLATSHGPTISPSSSGEGAWTEIAASTSDPIRHLSVGLQGNANTNAVGSTGVVDVGVGAAAAEAAVMEHFYYETQNNETVRQLVACSWPVSIPAGARLTGRAEGSTAVAGASIDAILYGVS